MSPYTVIPESAWRRWLRQERPEVVEFMPRIIQRAYCDPRDGRHADQPKPSGAAPGTRGVERASGPSGNAAGAQRIGSEGDAQARETARGRACGVESSKHDPAALREAVG